MTIQIKNSLIETARSLRERNDPAPLTTLAPAIQTQIYRRLWEIANPSSAHCDFGRAAFWNRDGQTATLAQKVQAVEDVLLANMPAPTPSPTPTPPPGSKPVQVDCFFDCGFDPRFDLGGNYLLPKPSFSFSAWAHYILFACKAYLSLNSEERAWRQAVLAAAKAESAFARATERAFMNPPDKEIYFSFACEHQFLNRTSDLYKIAHPQPSHPLRLFPSELLASIHSINKPQSETRWSKSLAKPGFENGDLSREATKGLWRLREEMYSRTIDPIEYRFVPHYIYINTLDKPSEELKVAIRAYRTALQSLVSDRKCALSFAACKEQLLPHLATLRKAWERYTGSHELLTEMQSIFSIKDDYQGLHSYYHWLNLMSHIPYFYYFYTRYLLETKNSGEYWDSIYRYNIGYNSLKTRILHNFPTSNTGRLLNARERAVKT